MTITDIFQPFYDLAYLIQLFYLIICLVLGVKAAFWFKSFFYAIIFASKIIFISVCLAIFVPTIIQSTTYYLGALGIGFISGQLVKRLVFWI